MRAPDLEELYRSHVGYVWTSLRCLGVDPADLDDATQDVFVLLHRRLGRLDLDRPLRPWLFGTCRNIAWRKKRRRAVRLRLRHRVVETRAYEDGVSSAECREAYDLFVACLAKLPTAQRDVYILSELHGCTRSEVADALGVSPNTVGSRLRLARRAMDRHLRRLRVQDDRTQLPDAVRGQLQPSEDETNRTWACIAVALESRAVGLPFLGIALKPLVIAASVAGLGGVGIRLTADARAERVGRERPLGDTTASRGTSAPSWNANGSMRASPPSTSARDDATRVDEVAMPGVAGEGATLGAAGEGAIPGAVREGVSPDAARQGASVLAGREDTTNRAAGEGATPSPVRRGSSRSATPRGGRPNRSRSASPPPEVEHPRDRSSLVLGTSAPSTSLADETHLVARAQAAVADERFDDALTLCSHHGERFPDAILAFECAQIEVKVHCRRGDYPAVEHRIYAWGQRYQRSRPDEKVEILRALCAHRVTQDEDSGKSGV